MPKYRSTFYLCVLNRYMYTLNQEINLKVSGIAWQ